MVNLSQSLILLGAIILIVLSLQYFQHPIQEYSAKKLVQLSGSNSSVESLQTTPQVWQTYLDGSRAKVSAPTSKRPTLPKDAWIERFLSSGNDSIDFTAVEENLCSKVTWDPTLVFQCEDTSGEEYSDARGQLLNCLRFAIELGAGIILPWVGGAPDAEALRRGTGRLAPFFDEPSFRANIASACPQLILYDTMEAVKRRGKVVPLPELSFNDIQRDSDEKSVLSDASQWIKDLEKWIRENTKKVQDNEKSHKGENNGSEEVDDENTEKIRVLKFPARLTFWRVCDDDDDVRYSLGTLLEPRKDVERLSASILYEMIDRYHLEVSADDPFVIKGYMGVQLYTWDDDDYYKKKEAIIKDFDSKSIHLMYAATNDRGILDRFFIDGYPRDVLWKPDLMTREEKIFLASLTTGAQTLVDQLILKSATYFVGVDRSSEAWMISASRRVAMKQQTCKLYTIDEGEVAFSDKWSWIYKNEDDHKGFVEGIWPS